MAGEGVVFDEEMAVAGKDERDIEATASGGVGFGLFQAMRRGEAFGLSLDEGDGDRLGLTIELDAQGVVGAPARPLACPASDDLDGAGSLLAADEVFGPTASVDGGIDQLGVCVGFGVAHCRLLSAGILWHRDSGGNGGTDGRRQEFHWASSIALIARR